MLLAARAWLLTCSRLVFPNGQHHSANSEVQSFPSWAIKARRHWRCKRPVKITIPMALAVFPELCSRGSCSRGPCPKGRLKNSPRTILATPLTPAIEFHCGQIRSQHETSPFCLDSAPLRRGFSSRRNHSPRSELSCCGRAKKSFRKHVLSTPCFGPAPVPYAGPFLCAGGNTATPKLSATRSINASRSALSSSVS